MGFLEDHPRTRKWLITMVIASPLGLFPFQMAFFYGFFHGVILTTYDTWNDPPSKGGGAVFEGCPIFSMARLSFSKGAQGPQLPSSVLVMAIVNLLPP